MSTRKCPLQSRKCGGCPLLGLPYEQQLAQKQQKARTLLERYAPVAPVLGQVNPWHYRNKAIATFAQGRGGVYAGIYAAGSHHVLPMPEEGCLLQDEVLNQTLKAAVDAARACRWPAYDEDRGTGLVRHVLVRRGVHTAQVMVVLVTAADRLPGSRNFVAALRPLGDHGGAQLQSPPYQRGAGQGCAGAVRSGLYSGHSVRAAVFHLGLQLLPGEPRPD